ncbi:Uncharacterised protein [Shewanella putrefaciens]|nr:Uncharacterised protein [Shewanella putrefaciens]
MTLPKERYIPAESSSSGCLGIIVHSVSQHQPFLDTVLPVLHS